MVKASELHKDRLLVLTIFILAVSMAICSSCWNVRQLYAVFFPRSFRRWAGRWRSLGVIYPGEGPLSVVVIDDRIRDDRFSFDVNDAMIDDMIVKIIVVLLLLHDSLSCCILFKTFSVVSFGVHSNLMNIILLWGRVTAWIPNTVTFTAVFVV